MKSFEVNTNRAYLNTEIIFRSIDKNCIIKDQTTGLEYNINSTLSLKLCAGEHILYCKENEQTEKIFIEDAIKLGGSKIKEGSSFISASTPWVCIVMKDRTYFHNRLTEEEFVEYSLSPDKITFIGGKNKEFLLFETKGDYSIFNANKHTISIHFKNLIYSNSSVVLYEEGGDVFLYNYIEDSCVLTTSDKYSIYNNGAGDVFYYIENGYYQGLNLQDFTSIANINKVESKVVQFLDKYAIEFSYEIMPNNNYLIIDLESKKIQYFKLEWFIESVGNRPLCDMSEVKKNIYSYIDENKERLDSLKYVKVLFEYCSVEKILRNKDNIDIYFTKYEELYYCHKQTNKTFLKLNFSTHKLQYLDTLTSLTNNTQTTNHSSNDNSYNCVAMSDCQSLCVMLDNGTLQEFNKKENSKRTILKNLFDTSVYRNAYFTSDGDNVVVVRNDNIANIMGFKDMEETVFDITNLSVAKNGCNGYKPTIDSAPVDSRIPVWRDPITLQRIGNIDKDLSNHIFLSPDKQYSAETEMRIKYINNITKKEITSAEYNNIKKDCDWDSNASENEKKLKIQKRKQRLSGHNLETLNIEKSWDFSAKLITRQCYVRCHNIKSSEFTDIEIGENIQFLNYVSFSYNSQYLAIAAKITNKSGVFILYDLDKKRIHTNNPNSTRDIYAVWMAIFNKEGNVAYYDSKPNTYLISDPNANCSPVIISGKSLLCFSPDGQYVALSRQGYTPYNNTFLWGHQPSGEIYIHKTFDPTNEYKHYMDFGADISGVADTRRNIASAAFSTDGKRLLAVDNDGVVVIRNLKLHNNKIMHK